MQTKEDLMVLVKTDLLLHEKAFNSLRECILELDYSKLELYDEFVYNSEEDKVVSIHQPIHPDYSNLNLICDKVENGYILISLYDLKKMLSL